MTCSRCSTSFNWSEAAWVEIDTSDRRAASAAKSPKTMVRKAVKATRRP